MCEPAVDYEMSAVDAVKAQQSRVSELLRHFYRTTLPEVRVAFSLKVNLTALFSIRGDTNTLNFVKTLQEVAAC